MDTSVITTVISAGAGLLGGGLAVFILSSLSQRRSVSKALLAEIHRLHTVGGLHLDLWSRWIENKETGKHPLIAFSCDVYEKHVENLGLVDKEIVGDIVKFYGYVKFINALQATRGKDVELHNGDSTSFDAMYEGTLKTFCDAYRKKFDLAFRRYGIYL